MARIRSIHPSVWTNERFVSVSRDARLLLIGLWGESDDKGAFEWKPIQIKMRLCAGDDVTLASVSGWLAELQDADLVQRYELDGSEYGAVRNFCKWQRPKKPNDIHPMPQQFRTYCGCSGEGSEPDADITHTQTEPVPNQFPTSGEKPPQRKEEGGRRGDRKEEPSLRDDAAVAARVAREPDARDRLWSVGLTALQAMTGLPGPRARALLGRFVKTARDDCSIVSAVLDEAAAVRPFDPVPWITEALKARTDAREGLGDKLAREFGFSFDDLPKTADFLEIIDNERPPSGYPQLANPTQTPDAADC